MADTRTRWVRPLVPLFQKLGVTPDFISYLGLSLLIPVAFFFESYPVPSALLLFLYSMMDAIDGCYARLIGTASQGGALTDIVVDQTGMVVVTLGLIYYSLIVPVFGAYYMAVYISMIALSVSQNAIGVPMQPIFRSKFVLYFLYFFWAIGLPPVFNYAVPVFAGAHTISFIQSFRRVKKHLDESPDW